MTEKSDVEKRIKAISGAKSDYIEQGVLLVELTQHLEDTFKNAGKGAKRKLVELVTSNRF